MVGGGPGGYAAAFLAADLGMQVTLIDPEVNPGGVCLYRGCIPSKALLHVAKLIEESQQAKNWGIDFPPAEDRSHALAHLERRRCKKAHRRVRTYSPSSATWNTFRAAPHLKIPPPCASAKTDATEVVLSFDRIILATGSRPAIIPALKLDSPRLMDSTGALNLEDIPGSLLVVGGGYIGLELGSVYAALGTRVTVVEMLPGLLPGADRDLVLPLHKRLEKMFETILLNTTVASLKEENAGIRATFEGTSLQEKEREKIFDRVLLSVGRKPNSEIHGLDMTHVNVTSRGFIEVNKQLQTADPSIYAIGDVVGEPMLAHKACTKVGSPRKPLPDTKSPSSPMPFLRLFSPIRKLPGAASPKHRRKKKIAKSRLRSFPGAHRDERLLSTVPKA